MEIQSCAIKNMSYFTARDPSITLNYNFPSKIRRNLASQLGKSDEESHDDNHYQVYLRIKNTSNIEQLYKIKDDNTLLCKVPDGAQCIRNIRDNATTKTFTFSKIIDPLSTQTDLFNNVIKDKVLLFINGYNCTLMSYGASGSGKTFTIVGTAEDPGIIPRSLEYLFRTLPSLPKRPRIKPTVCGGVTYLTESQFIEDKTCRQRLLNEHHINMDRAHHMQTYKAMQERLSREPVALIDKNLGPDVLLNLWISFAEIYNENIYDLLKPEPSRGKQREKLRLGNINGTVYIKDLTSISISSGLEAYLILQYGLHNLNYAATSVNKHSSRSHCIFTLKLAQASSKSEGVHVSVFNFCDLAGSERFKKTHNEGERLKESNSINTSLLVLGRCIKLVRDSQKNKNVKLIPFRESKLTQLFQKALSGQEPVSMVVNINPTRDMFDETLHVLNFSAIAKNVIVEQQHLKPDKRNRFSQFIERDVDVTSNQNKSYLVALYEQISLLNDDLVQQRLNNEEDRDHVKSTYKKILTDTDTYWQNKYDNFKDSLSNLRENFTRGKRKASSVIVLDSSSDDDDEITDYNEAGLRSEILEMQSKLNTLRDEIDKKQIENHALEDTLNCATKEYLESELTCETHIGMLKAKMVGNDEQIKELNAYIDFKLQAVHSDITDTESHPSLETEDTLNGATQEYLESELTCETHIGMLKTKMVGNDEQIKELNAYFDFKLQAVHSDITDTESHPSVETEDERSFLY